MPLQESFLSAGSVARPRPRKTWEAVRWLRATPTTGFRVYLPNLVMWRSTLSCEVRHALDAADVVTKGIGTPAHAVATPAALVATAATLAAYPAATKLFKPTPPRRAVWRCQASSRGARVIVIDVLCIIVLQSAAGYLAIGGVGRCVFAEDVVHHHFDIPSARKHVVVVEIVVLAHDGGGYARSYLVKT